MRSRLPLAMLFACKLKRLRRERNGSASVEFVMVATPFFALLFAIVETGIFFFAAQSLELATQDTARLVMTGQTQIANQTAAQFKTELCNRLLNVFDCTGGISVDVRSFPSFSSVSIPDPVGGGTCAPSITFSPGHAGDIVVVRTFYKWPLVVTGLGYNIGNCTGNKKLLVSTIAFRNEPGTF